MTEIKSYLDIATKHLKKLQGQTTGSTLAGVSAGGLGVLAAPLLGAIAVEAGAIFGIALLGFSIYSIEGKRKKAKEDFDTKVQEWQTARRNPLRDQYRENLNSATDRINRIIDQYKAYVYIEQERTSEMKSQMDRLNVDLEFLEKEIGLNE